MVVCVGEARHLRRTSPQHMDGKELIETRQMAQAGAAVAPLLKPAAVSGSCGLGTSLVPRLQPPTPPLCPRLLHQSRSGWASRVLLQKDSWLLYFPTSEMWDSVPTVSKRTATLAPSTPSLLCSMAVSVSPPCSRASVRDGAGACRTPSGLRSPRPPAGHLQGALPSRLAVR